MNSRIAAEAYLQERKRRVENFRSDPKQATLVDTYYQLQQLDQRFSVDIPFPELIVLGQQGEGKSAFIECMVGFKFNISQDGIGTRRPLLIQMINDQTKDTPHITFTSPADVQGVITNVEECLATIEQLNEQIDGISEEAIGVEIRYKHCSFCSIIDTPGFRYDDDIGEKIANMVKQYVKKKPNALLVYVQTGQDWSITPIWSESSVIRQLDPDCNRTILLSSKFDVRASQFAKKDLAETYLQGFDAGIRVKTTPYFCAAPTGQVNGQEFIDLLQKVNISTIERVLDLGFTVDELKNYNIGVYDCIHHLEKRLFGKFQQQFAEVLAKLQSEISKLEMAIKENNELVTLLQERIANVVNNFILCSHELVDKLDRMIEGSTRLVETRGQTKGFARSFEKDSESSGHHAYINNNSAFEFEHKSHNLVGGAACRRAISWIQNYLINAPMFNVTDDEINNLFALETEMTANSFERQASRLVCEKVDEVFSEPIKAFCSLFLAVTNHTLDAIVESSPDKPEYRRLAQIFKEHLRTKAVECEKNIFLDIKKLSEQANWLGVQQSLPALAADLPQSAAALDTNYVQGLIFGGRSLQSLLTNVHAQVCTPEIRTAFRETSKIFFAQIKVRLAQVIPADFGIFFRQQIKPAAPTIVNRIRTVPEAELKSIVEGGQQKIIQEHERKQAQLVEFKRVANMCNEIIVD